MLAGKWLSTNLLRNVRLLQVRSEGSESSVLSIFSGADLCSSGDLTCSKTEKVCEKVSGSSPYC